MAKNNRKCAICGKLYSYCPGCGEDKDKPTWMTTFDTDNCREIYKITSNYIGGAITADQARGQLKNHDLTRTDSYNKVIAERIDQIMGTEKTEEVKEEVKEETKEEVKIPEYKSDYKKKKRPAFSGQKKNSEN